MLFNSFQFAVFLAIVIAALVASPRRYGVRILALSSLAFYALWVPSYLILLAGTLAANYGLNRLMLRSARPRRYLVASIGLTLSLLALFKYAAAALELVAPLLEGAAGAHLSLPDFVLPLGISFYSFEIISLSVDMYRGRLGCPRFQQYVLFVTFFPHLIAGPIMRGEELLPQLEAGGDRNARRRRRGLWLFAVGLFKKAVLSDGLFLPFVESIFGMPGAANGPVHLVAMYSFAFQIYFDFSGYTDMARGIACVLGFELPMNFEEPYLSRDPSEFWRRWHMTLSRWLRDYVYFPLGGNRRGGARTVGNLMATMLLGGLWHGAGPNFVLWGGLHGLLLVGHRLVCRGQRSERGELRWADVPRIVLLFHAVCFIWVPFRAETFADAVSFYRGVFSGGYVRGWPLLPLAIAAFGGALHVLERYLRGVLPSIFAKIESAHWGPAVEGGLLGAVIATSVLAAGGGVEFIYFQF